MERFKDRETVAGAAAYDAAGRQLAASSGLAVLLGYTPPSVWQVVRKGWAGGEFLNAAGQPIHVAAVPLRNGGTIAGALAIVHDTAYIDTRTDALWRRALLGLAVQTVVIFAITLLFVRLSVRRPMHHMTQWLRECAQAREPVPVAPAGEFEPLAREVTQLATSLTAARAAAQEEARLRDTAESTWTTERLRVFVEGRLGGTRLFAVSNREPYEHLHRPAESRVSCPPADWSPRSSRFCAPATEPGSRRAPATRTGRRWTSSTTSACLPIIRNTRCAASG